jgi:uncharacterized membrane protein YphA (DoxX/SURF4 family)
MPRKTSSKLWVNKLISLAIAIVWLVNGLFCKLLNLVPRHQQIVSRILGDEYAAIATKAIGVSEVFMCIWVLTGIKSRLCTIFQIVIVALLNIIEYILAPDLLLFGRTNIIFATLLIIVIFINGFVINKKYH